MRNTSVAATLAGSMCLLRMAFKELCNRVDYVVRPLQLERVMGGVSHRSICSLTLRL